MNYLPSNIKFLRQSNNLTQDDLAEIVGKTRSLISAWETDERDITTEDIIRLSNHFNISMDDLVGRDLRINDDDIQSQYAILFNKKAMKALDDKDKELIVNIIETRKKQIDKELGED